MVYIVFANTYPDPYGVILQMLYASKSVEEADKFAEQTKLDHPEWDVWVEEQGLDVPETTDVYWYVE